MNPTKSKTNKLSTLMKATAFLLVTALVTPAALAFGASAAVVGATATGIALSSIALGDYGKRTCSYRDHDTAKAKANAKQAERHPLAA
ncbi:hypothetical protein [Actomonas aquatica]|uniref:Uncharacterized protein n=1 Tax=Actomonas aquatica TaxID=2866162 RepID=A0ABZ1CER6_9BACT|nr:hypothetical protein [Opitutus sp. WL0086]WRQ89855.1 hypothetical protein K1X11_010600 [Opitutus sp. WL0086]